jgi:sigma-B regulation protein RsbU (phosphoserine phosphatase)
MREIIFLSAIYIATYAGFILWLQYGLHLPVRSFPRFHAVLDGVTYMMVAGTTSLIIRYNDLRRDMDNFMLLKRIESQTVQFEKELELARRVNQTLVPIPFANEKAEIAVTYLPMGYVGGDYAKFRFIDNDRLIIFISDVTGHGVPAALLVNRVHAEFERLIGDESGPGKLLNKLNQFITRDFEGTQMYLSAFCGILDFRQKTFTYSNYGHLPQYLWRDGEKMILDLDSHRSFLGISFDDSEHHETVAYFGKGDNLLLFTDGVVEARDQRGSQYGEARLRDFMKRNSGKPAEPFNEALTHELRGVSGNSFDDDIFIMNVKVL